MNKRYLILLLSAAVGFQACNSAKKHFTKAEEHHDRQEYADAIERYQEALAKGHREQGKIYYKLAESYRKSNRPHDAKEYYAKAIGKVDDDEVIFWYAYALKANGEYANAEQQFQKYIDRGTNFDLINRAKNEIENLKVLEEIAAKTTEFKVAPLGHLNTTEVEYAPFKLKDKIYFTSSRGANVMFPGTGTGFTDIWEFTYDGINDTTGALKQLDKIINSENAHEATPVFSRDGKTMYFSRGNTGEKKGSHDVDIYMSRMGTDGMWAEPVKLEINDEHGWDSSPMLSSDGKRLYFASDREGGNGGVDLYVATIDKNGTWGNVKNLGTPINSRGNDMFPFEAEDGTLYFSSDGHPSLGSLDIFKVVKGKEGEVTVENLGKPVNSNYDDFSIFMTDSLNGFYSSNRPGGKGDDDIYKFEKEFILFYAIDGQTFGRDAKNNEYELEEVEIAVIENKSKDTVTIYSGKKGKFLYMAEAEKTYTLIGSKKGYLESDRVQVSVKKPKKGEYSNRDTVWTAADLKLVLPEKKEGIIVKVNNIFYEFNSDKLTADSKKSLDTLVMFLNTHPEISIELRSHTDFRGSRTYNKDLSQRRAQSAVNYLIEQGIDKKRLAAGGYGEDIPAIIKDAKGKEVKLTEKYILGLPSKDLQEEAHQINRRTEFKVTGIDESKEIKIENVEQMLNHN